MATISPRKQPIQARSRATVEAILEATSRVLVEDGYAAMTTTRVAERAGVGVGTLYQYFPSKDALVMALLERSMAELESSIASAIERVEGASLDDAIEAMIDGLLASKRRRADLKSALRRQLPRVQGDVVVRATMRKLQTLVRRALEPHASELRGVDLDLASAVLTTSIEGAVSSALDYAPRLLRSRELRDALVALARGYLRESTRRTARS